MGRLDPNVSLASLSLPGTHNSGARLGGKVAQCQTLSIAQQLDRGVRLLDIRLKLQGERLQVYHGIVDQKTTLEAVLTASYAFMIKNPTEAIVMSIKNEQGRVNEQQALAFEKAVNARIDQDRAKWFVADRIPTLAEAQSKIVLFRRYDAITEQRGIAVSSGWDDDAVFAFGDAIVVQDRYKIGKGQDEGEKWRVVQNHLNEAIGGDQAKLYVNFLSATGGFFGPYPIDVARGRDGVSKGMVGHMADFLKRHEGKKRLGWILFDFPSETALNRLIESNFEY